MGSIAHNVIDSFFSLDKLKTKLLKLGVKGGATTGESKQESHEVVTINGEAKVDRKGKSTSGKVNGSSCATISGG